MNQAMYDVIAEMVAWTAEREVRRIQAELTDDQDDWDSYDHHGEDAIGLIEKLLATV